MSKKHNLKELRKSFNTKHAIKITVKSWEGLCQYCTNALQTRLHLQTAHDNRRFEFGEEINKIKPQRMELCKEFGFDEVGDADVVKLPEPQKQQLSMKNLALFLKIQRTCL
jgi:hypothetical protein